MSTIPTTYSNDISVSHPTALESEACHGVPKYEASSAVQNQYECHLEDIPHDASAFPPASTVIDGTIYRGINELEAPPPAQDLRVEHLQPHLEDSQSAASLPPYGKPLKSKLYLQLTTNCWLIFFSIWGTLARLGFTGITRYPGAVISGGQSGGSGVIWANFTGCVVIGFLIEDLKLFGLRKTGKEFERDINTVPTLNDPEPQVNMILRSPVIDKSSTPLYVGLTTGFCGSFTSFSSFMLQSFLYLSNTLPSYTHSQKGFAILSFLGYIVVTVALSMSGLQFGAHLAMATQDHFPSIPNWLIRALDRTALFWAIGIWAGSIVMAAFVEKWRGEALFACVFSPLGVLGRYWASKFLNPRTKQFPLGTFWVNIVGTIVLAAVTVGEYSHDWSKVYGDSLGCQLLTGVGDGFCGCLTTVSTWAVELRTLRRRHSYIYAFATLAAGTIIMTVILGSYAWSHSGLNPSYHGSC
ncbi:CrcB-like protein-domain-containing protein [Kalaharituber pfeilii]|nr:CrcB-like protein-domain-containing protein [Kalaharituber pfeilii]